MMALKRGGFAGLGKRKKYKGLLGGESMCKSERLSERVAGMWWGMREQR
jgi:hypothetical protein